jgi:hypothetical protein
MPNLLSELKGAKVPGRGHKNDWKLRFITSGSLLSHLTPEGCGYELRQIEWAPSKSFSAFYYDVVMKSNSFIELDLIFSEFPIFPWSSGRVYVWMDHSH